MLWRPAFFGIKPELVIKGGFIAWAAMGDSAASLDDLRADPDAAAMGRLRPRPAGALACFVHPLAIERDLAGQLGPIQDAVAGQRNAEAEKARHAAGMMPARASASIPQTFDVFVDGVLATCEPARVCRSRSATCCDDAMLIVKRRGVTPQPAAARVGIGGPVGSGKTALIERLIPALPTRGVDLAVMTNDLVTAEDAERPPPLRA